MTRLDFHAACRIAHERETAKATDLAAAHGQLRMDVQLAEIAMKRIDEEFVRRVNARRVRENNEAIAHSKGLIE